MIYKIIVDKQSRLNPSNEKREYEVDIEELRCKGDVYDSLIITKDEDYVMRRLSLSEYHVLKVLDESIKEPLPNINIKLFEGENYIYLADMEGNKLYAEYLVKNEFNDMYVIKSEMNTEINQTAQSIELSVNQRFKNANNEISKINGKLELKIDKNDNDQVVSMINASANEINLNSNRLTIDSDNFKLTKEGNMTCNNANVKGHIESSSGNIGGFSLSNTSFSTNINGIYKYNAHDARNAVAMAIDKISVSSVLKNLYDITGNGNVELIDAQNIVLMLLGQKENGKNVTGKFEINSQNPKDFLLISENGQLAVSLGIGGVNTNLLSAENIVCSTRNDTEISIAMNGSTGEITAKNFNNISLEETKKNIKEIDISANKIIKETKIYTYNYKNENDKEKKHIGLVIGNNYKTPIELMSTDKTSIDIYSMCSILWKAVQEQQEEIEKQNKKIEELIERIEKLEVQNEKN